MSDDSSDGARGTRSFSLGPVVVWIAMVYYGFRYLAAGQRGENAGVFIVGALLLAAGVPLVAFGAGLFAGRLGSRFTEGRWGRFVARTIGDPFKVVLAVMLLVMLQGLRVCG